MKKTQTNYICWFYEPTVDDVTLVGGKNASLGETYHEQTLHRVPRSNRIATTACACKDKLPAAGGWDKLHDLLDDLFKRNVQVLVSCANQAREIIWGGWDQVVNCDISHLIYQERHNSRLDLFDSPLIP